MPSFTDTKGRVWVVRITPYEMREVKDFAGINLGTILQDQMKPLADLLGDPVDLCSVVYAICKEQADKRQIDLKDFMEGIVGQPMEDAAAALVEGLQDCFPPRQRAMLTATLTLMKTDQKQTQKQINTLLKQLTYISSTSRWRRCWAWLTGAIPARNST